MTLPIVAIHGWGAHPAFFETLREALDYPWIDFPLPGHGVSEKCDNPRVFPEQPRALISYLQKRIPEQGAILLGWSLGGAVAQFIERDRPSLVKANILLASTPCFVNQKGWYGGVDSQQAREFAEQLVQKPYDTLNQYYRQLCLAEPNPRALLRQVEQLIRAYPEPDRDSLVNAIRFLHRSDFRDGIELTDTPTLWLLGEKDPVIDAEKVKHLVQKGRHNQIVIINGAGHLPFMSRLDAVVHEINQFTRGLR